MDTRLDTARGALRIAIGLTATLAGIDKFFNVLADWTAYVSPLAAQVLPLAPDTLMAIVGVVEAAVGATILLGWTRLGAYVAGAWLLGVAVNLVLAGYYDIAVRDVVMSLAAFTLAQLEEVRQEAASPLDRARADRSAVTPTGVRAGA